MSAPAPYSFSRNGRNWATLITVLGVWLAVLVGWLVFDAAPWLLVVVLLFTLPAIWDIYTARTAGTDLTTDHLRWYSGAHEVSVPLSDIDHVRFVTRLDLSVRAAAVLQSGRKLRLPAEATPPAKPFEDALIAMGIKTQRHHFTFL